MRVYPALKGGICGEQRLAAVAFDKVNFEGLDFVLAEGTPSIAPDYVMIDDVVVVHP